MHRFLRLIALTLTLSLVLSHEASAQRLRDSLTARTSAPSAFARTPVLTAATTFDQSLLRDSVLTIARSQIGARYRLGAETPGKAFDCSGLIRYVMGALSFSLPRTAHEQSKFGREVARDTSQLRPGDLLTFGTSRRITHIGIYAGDGKVIHASTSKRQVIETSLASLGPSLLRKWQSARRLITLADSAGESQ